MNSNTQKLYQRRRLITVGVGAIVVITLVVFGYWQLFTYHATKQSNAEAAMNGSTPTVVMYYRPTCPDCIQVEKTTKLAELQSKLNGSSASYHDVYINVTTSFGKQEVKNRNVKWTPTYMVFKNGQAQVIGTQNGLPVYQYTGKDQQTIKNIYQKLSMN